MNDEPARQYCSEVSAAAGENMLGTAPEVDFWILLEYRETWSRKPLEDNNLPQRVQDWLTAQLDKLTSEGRLPRFQFLRKPGRPSPQLSLLTCSGGELRLREFDSYLDLLDSDVHTDSDSVIESNQYFVCTHGTRDLCCARFGLPTCRRLIELSNGRVWQTSHLGGHRYAPNVLALPSGRLYGRVHPESAESFFHTVESGKVSIEHLRGRSEFPKEAQACEFLVDVEVNSVAECNSEFVSFATDKGEVRVQVPQLQEEFEVLGSCGDEEPTVVRPFSGTA